MARGKSDYQKKMKKYLKEEMAKIKKHKKKLTRKDVQTAFKRAAKRAKA